MVTTEGRLKALVTAIEQDTVVPLSVATSEALRLARQHLAGLERQRESAAEHDARYPEHAKLAKVKDASQAIGEFLDLTPWTLMEYREWDEPWEEECDSCFHGSTEAPSYKRCVEEKRCRRCKGEHVIRGTRHHEGHFPVPGGIQGILARYFGIDQTKLDDEKRAMLAAIREGAA